MSLVAYQSSSDESEEEEVRVSPLNAKAPSNSAASVQQKSREPVKIAVPSLHEFEVESDEPSKKPLIKASCGLLSLLPAPKHSSKALTLTPNSVKKKVIDSKKLPNVFSTPHSSDITKKKIGETLERKVSSQEFVNKQVGQENEMKRESGNDMLSSDFFSLTNESSESTIKASKNDNPPADFFSFTNESSESTTKARKNDIPPVDFFSLTNESSESATKARKNDILPKDFFTNTPTAFDDCNKELFSFKDNILENSNQHSHQDYGSYNTNEAMHPINCISSDYQPECKAAAEHAFPSSSYGVYDSNSSSSASNEVHFTGTASEEGCNEQMSTDMMNDERFLRLQGKRRREFEDIDIIDVNVDSQLADRTQWFTKSITEEKKVSFSRKKGELPTQQQRRKHQITYLAFQAKERELDLKNQWAQNRLTKRETQSKYGF